jgi:hypothetical protein
MNRNDLIELSKQSKQNEYIIKTVKPGRNHMTKFNNDYMEINILNVDFFKYLLNGFDGKFKKFDVIFLDFENIEFLMPKNLVFDDKTINIDEDMSENQFLLRKLSQNFYLCTRTGQTKIKLNSLTNSRLHKFFNLNLNQYQLNIEPYKKIYLNDHVDAFNFDSSNFYEFKFDNAASLKFHKSPSKLVILVKYLGIVNSCFIC